MNAGVAEGLPSSEAIRRTAEEVLGRPYYNLDVTSYDLSVIKRALEFLKWLFSPLFNLFEILNAISPVLAWGTMLVLLVILVALIVHIVYSFKQAFTVRKRLAGFADPGVETKLDPRQLERKANEALIDGDYVLALRFLLKSAIMHLEEVYDRKPRRAATNRENLRFYTEAEVFAPLSLLVETVDVKWYGGRDCTREDYEQGAIAHAAIRGHATRRGFHAHRA